MWFNGLDADGHAKIYYTNSTDGINWNTPVLVLDVGVTGSYDDAYAHKPSVVYKDGEFWMFYSAQQNGGNRTIALAKSTNPWGQFTKYGVVLEPTETWEDGFLDCPSVMYDEEDGNWKMWYSAGKLNGVDEPEYICYSTSTDGYNWVKYSGNPIISPLLGSWQGGALGGSQVIKMNGDT